MNHIILSTKKWIVRALLGLGITFGLTACSGSGSDNSGSSTDSTKTKKHEAPSIHKEIKNHKIESRGKKIEQIDKNKLKGKELKEDIKRKKKEEKIDRKPQANVYGPPRDIPKVYGPPRDNTDQKKPTPQKAPRDKKE
ncbi:MAG: hypothetical protein IKX31_07890 [Muribaculaceae bacterium]|nr:hypothetical protein [Muribaculaceae bacterium]